MLSTLRIPASVRRAALVVAAELAVTTIAWQVVAMFGKPEGSFLPVFLAWGACFVLYTAPIQGWLSARATGYGQSLNLLLTSVAVWFAMTTTDLICIYPAVVGTLAMEIAQRDSSTRTTLVGLFLMFTGTGAALLAIQQGWVRSVVEPEPSAHVALTLMAIGSVLLVRGVGVSRQAAATRSALSQAQRLRHDELRYAAAHDALTGLLSRRGLDPVLQAASAAARPGAGVALLFLDLDGFKAVNDSYGHAVGDRLLTEAADRFSAVLGPDAALARMGGDEFVAVLSGTPSASAAGQLLAEVQATLDESFRLRLDEVRPDELRLDGASSGVEYVEVSVGVSAGLAWADQPTDPEALMREADRGMYRDKRKRQGERRRQAALRRSGSALPSRLPASSVPSAARP